MKRRVFADTFYFCGLANRRDHWHTHILQAKADLGDCATVTTDEVLTEFLAALSGYSVLRIAAQTLINALFLDSAITVLPQSRKTFLDGYALYQTRPDKQYRLTDCISMNTCRAESITEILTNDNHFTQKGFTILITR